MASDSGGSPHRTPGFRDLERRVVRGACPCKALGPTALTPLSSAGLQGQEPHAAERARWRGIGRGQCLQDDRHRAQGVQVRRGGPACGGGGTSRLRRWSPRANCLQRVRSSGQHEVGARARERFPLDPGVSCPAA